MQYIGANQGFENLVSKVLCCEQDSFFFGRQCIGDFIQMSFVDLDDFWDKFKIPALFSIGSLTFTLEFCNRLLISGGVAWFLQQFAFPALFSTSPSKGGEKRGEYELLPKSCTSKRFFHEIHIYQFKWIESGD